MAERQIARTLPRGAYQLLVAVWSRAAGSAHAAFGVLPRPPSPGGFHDLDALPELLRGQVPDPHRAITAHDYAPRGLAFYSGQQFPTVYRGNLFVALHGSWNRAQPQGYKVVRVPMNGGPPGTVEDFGSGLPPSRARSTTRAGRRRAARDGWAVQDVASHMAESADRFQQIIAARLHRDTVPKFTPAPRAERQAAVKARLGRELADLVEQGAAGTFGLLGAPRRAAWPAPCARRMARCL